MIKIDSKFSFKSKLNKGTIALHSIALKQYKDVFQEVSNLKGDTKLFLDTNVLLHIYKISFKARKKLISFLKRNKDRIIITHQIQEEFLRNREKTIDDFYSTEANSLSSNFKKSTINQLDTFLEKNKTILIDFDFLEKKVQEIKEECQIYLERLDEKIKKININHQIDKFDDEVLRLFKEFKLTEKLDNDEIEFLNNEFDSLAKEIHEKKDGKIKSYSNRSYKAFPGMGDLVDKPNFPYGDYYIFHEMLKYIKEHNKNVAFLTFDTTKGDWLRTNKEPHIHYIESTYLNTNQSLIILDAERTLEKVLDISFKEIKEENHFDSTNNTLSYIEKDTISSFLISWVKLEKLILKIATRLSGSVRIHLIIALKVLQKNEFIMPWEYDEIKQLSNYRNSIVHGNFGHFLELPPLERKQLLGKIDYYTQMLYELNQ